MRRTPMTTQVCAEGLRGGALDVHWPCIPVAHLSYETDGYFTTIHCPAA